MLTGLRVCRVSLISASRVEGLVSFFWFSVYSL